MTQVASCCWRRHGLVRANSTPPPSPAIINEPAVDRIREPCIVFDGLSVPQGSSCKGYTNRKMRTCVLAQQQRRAEVEALYLPDYLAIVIGNQEGEARTASLLLITPSSASSVRRTTATLSSKDENPKSENEMKKGRRNIFDV